MKRTKNSWIRSAVVFVIAGGSCWAQIIDPLHGCIIGTNCADNGTVTPTSINSLPTFTFTVSPPNSTNNPGDLLVEILVPNDVSGAGLENYTIGATLAGSADTSTIAPITASLVGNWTSGDLHTFLGLTLSNGSPKNNITAWLPYVNANGDSAATGFDVYQVDLGDTNLQGPGTPTAPVMTLGGTSSLPIASLLVGFLGSGTTFGTSSDFVSTANSGAIFEADAPPNGGGGGGGGSVPEPFSVTLLATVCLVVGYGYRKKARLS